MFWEALLLKAVQHTFLLFIVVTLSQPVLASKFDEVDGLWQFKTVKMKYMPHPDFQVDDMEEMMLNAASQWNNAQDGPMIEIERSDLNINTPAFDGVNALFVSDNWEWDPNFLALTFSHVHKGNKTILETDIGLNPNHNWVFGDFNDVDGNPDPSAFDLESTYAHEFGHVLGVPHIVNSAEATMYPEITSFELIKRDLTSEDTDCVITLYEGIELTEPFDPNADNNSDGGGCQSTPIQNGFSILTLLILLRLKKRKTTTSLI